MAKRGAAKETTAPAGGGAGEPEPGFGDLLEDDGATSRRAAKASVFTNLFGEPEYTYQLYRALHPEDEASTVGDIALMTLESHLLNQQYNDLGFMVGDRLVILVEAQSTWSENIVVRVLLYVAQTWYKYIKRTRQDVYGSKRVSLPRPELYVVYTGKGSRPAELTLGGGFFGDARSDVECRVRVLTGGVGEGDVIGQYVRFCHVLDAQVRLHGRTRSAVEETIRICQNEGVLKEYLERQRAEVIDMMLTLFDQETLMQNHDAALAREAREEGQRVGREEGLMEGQRVGREEERLASIRSVMASLKTDAEGAMDVLGVPSQERDRYLALL